MKLFFAIAACLLLCACQGTTFQTAPLADRPCEHDLAGQWLSVGDESDPDGEVELRIDAACRVELDEHGKDGTKTGPATALHLGRDGTQDYLWVDARWALARFAPERTAQDGEVFVLRYRLDRDRLDLRMTDDKAVAHLIIDGKIRGDVHSVDGDLFNRITGGAQPEALSVPGVFEDRVLAFRRGKGGSVP